jgi:hypothetical protein
MLAVVTLVAVFLAWLGYNLNWISQRREALKWLGRHRVVGSIAYDSEPRPDLPWSLKVLGQSPLRLHCVGARNEEMDDLSAFRARVAAIAELFPECQIVDASNYRKLGTH